MTVINIIFGVVVPFVLLVCAGCFIKNYHNDNVIKWVQIAVYAAEQIYNESGQGKEKYKYVSEWISQKFNISKKDLKNIIESAVFEMKNNIK